MPTFIDLTGQRFGRLLVIECVGRSKNQKSIWRCKCDCGKEKIILAASLRNGRSQSCGCLHNELLIKTFTTHGLGNTRLASIKKGILKRCYKPKCKSYKGYGERGIYVCEEWLNNPSAFFEWSLSNGYEDHLSIDRIDNDGPYSPENCRWATQTEQANNTRRNRILTLNGVSQSPASWARELKVNVGTIYSRMHQNWTDEEILTIPRGKKRKKER